VLDVRTNLIGWLIFRLFNDPLRNLTVEHFCFTSQRSLVRFSDRRAAIMRSVSAPLGKLCNSTLNRSLPLQYPLQFIVCSRPSVWSGIINAAGKSRYINYKTNKQTTLFRLNWRILSNGSWEQVSLTLNIPFVNIFYLSLIHDIFSPLFCWFFTVSLCKCPYKNNISPVEVHYEPTFVRGVVVTDL